MAEFIDLTGAGAAALEVRRCLGGTQLCCSGKPLAPTLQAPFRAVYARNFVVDLTEDDEPPAAAAVAAAGGDQREPEGRGAAGEAAAAAAAAGAVGGTRQWGRGHRAVLVDLVGGSQEEDQPRSPAARRKLRAKPPARNGRGATTAELAAAAAPPWEEQQQQQQAAAPRQGLLGKRAEPEAPSTQRCDICFDDVPLAMMHSFLGCGHAFCLGCLREYISGEVEARKYPVACPLPNCKKPVSTAECNLVLTPEEQDVLGKLEAEAAIDGSVRLFCPNQACSMLLIADQRQADEPLDCPHCTKPICAACGVLWHAGLTCAQFQALPTNARGNADAELLALANKENWRRCPNCGNMVERTEGCSFIVCRCRHTFCYGCGKKLSHSNHYCTCRPQREQWALPAPGVAAAAAGGGARAAAAARPPVPAGAAAAAAGRAGGGLAGVAALLDRLHQQLLAPAAAAMEQHLRAHEELEREAQRQRQRERERRQQRERERQRERRQQRERERERQRERGREVQRQQRERRQEEQHEQRLQWMEEALQEADAIQQNAARRVELQLQARQQARAQEAARLGALDQELQAMADARDAAGAWPRQGEGQPAPFGRPGLRGVEQEVDQPVKREEEVDQPIRRRRR